MSMSPTVGSSFFSPSTPQPMDIPDKDRVTKRLAKEAFEDLSDRSVKLSRRDPSLSAKEGTKRSAKEAFKDLSGRSAKLQRRDQGTSTEETFEDFSGSVVYNAAKIAKKESVISAAVTLIDVIKSNLFSDTKSVFKEAIDAFFKTRKSLIDSCFYNNVESAAIFREISGMFNAAAGIAGIEPQKQSKLYDMAARINFLTGKDLLMAENLEAVDVFRESARLFSAAAGVTGIDPLKQSKFYELTANANGFAGEALLIAGNSLETAIAFREAARMFRSAAEVEGIDPLKRAELYEFSAKENVLAGNALISAENRAEAVVAFIDAVKMVKAAAEIEGVDPLKRAELYEFAGESNFLLGKELIATGKRAESADIFMESVTMNNAAVSIAGIDPTKRAKLYEFSAKAYGFAATALIDTGKKVEFTDVSIKAAKMFRTAAGVAGVDPTKQSKLYEFSANYNLSAGKALLSDGKNKKAIEVLKEAAKMFREAASTYRVTEIDPERQTLLYSEEGHSYSLSGRVLFADNKFEESINALRFSVAAFRSAVKVERKRPSTVKRSTLYESLGNTNFSLGNILLNTENPEEATKALSFAFDELTIAARIDGIDMAKKLSIYRNAVAAAFSAGETLISLRRTAESIEMFKKACAISMEASEVEGINPEEKSCLKHFAAMQFNNAAEILRYHAKTKKIAPDKAKLYASIANFYELAGNALIAAGHKELAAEKFELAKKASKLFEKIKEKDLMPEVAG